jgi:integrase
MAYVDTTRRPPKTMTLEEQRRLLATTGEHRQGYRDHLIISLALGTALREHEIVALNVGDISDDGETVRRRFPLRVYKRSSKDPSAQECILPDGTHFKLKSFLKWKRKNGESLAPDAPLFVSRNHRRLSMDRLRHAFADWQERAGLERHFTFHQLRHTALTNLYRARKDIRIVQKIARHKNLNTTGIYAHPSDEDVLRAVRDLPC